MHYDTHYSGNDTESDRAKARADAKEFLGDARFATIDSEFRKIKDSLTFPQFQFYCSIAGVQGYPVSVWFRDVTGKEPEPEK